MELRYKPKFKECDYVEVIVEKDKYAKHGVHCGDKSFIVLNEMIKNEMLVDFTGVDENGDIYGEEVSININDLKLVEKMSLTNRFIFLLKFVKFGCGSWI